MKNLRLHTNPILCFNDMMKKQNIPLAPLKRGIGGMCLALWLCWAAAVQAQNQPQPPLTEGAFVTVWQIADTNNDGSISQAERTITIPTEGTGYDYTVKWGDGNTSSNQSGNATHTYNAAGDYRVTITGAFPAIYFYGGGKNADRSNAAKLREVRQWGSQQWRSMNRAFYRCTNLQITATDAPNLSKVTDMSAMFQGCSALTGHVSMSRWNVSNVKNMTAMFSQAKAFNQSLNEWDVSNVTHMNAMFSRATAFNQPLDKWDVSNVEEMGWMFSGATDFNQSLNGWNVSNVKNMRSMFRGAVDFDQPLNKWDVSNVSNMTSMFEDARVFNQPLDEWNVSLVDNMSGMFRGAAAFDRPLHKWNVSKVSNMSGMFEGASTLSKGHYTQLLMGWAGKLPNTQLLMDWAGKLPNKPEDAEDLGTLPSTYCASAQSVVNTLKTKGWLPENYQGESEDVALPQVEGEQRFCKDGAQVNALAATGDNIKWYADANGGTALKPAVNLIDGKTYYATQTTLEGCESQRRAPVTVRLTVTTRAEVNFYYGSDATATSAAFAQSTRKTMPTVATPAGGSFSRNRTGLSLHGSTGRIDLSASTAGEYIVTYTPPATICARPATFKVEVTTQNPKAPLSLQDVKASRLQVSPIPTAGVLHVRLTHPAAGKLVLRLSTPAGAVAVTHTTRKTGEVWRHALDLSDLPKGVYMLEVIGEGQRWKRKVVIQ